MRPPPRMPLFLLAGLIVAATALAACGGDDDDELSAQGLRQEANATCAEGAERAVEVEAPTSAPQAADFGQEMGGVVRDMHDELAELEPPGEMSDDFDSYVAELDRQADALDDLATGETDPAQVQRTFRDLSGDAPRLAGALRLRDCVAANDAIVKTP